MAASAAHCLTVPDDLPKTSSTAPMDCSRLDASEMESLTSLMAAAPAAAPTVASAAPAFLATEVSLSKPVAFDRFDMARENFRVSASTDTWMVCPAMS